MAGPRERSRNRSTGRQDGHEMQNLRTSHHSPAADSNAEDEETYDDSRHGHPQTTGAQHLDGTGLRTWKERLARALRRCKDDSARFLRTWTVNLTTPCMMTIYKGSAILIVVVFALWAAFYGYIHSAEPFNHGLPMGHLRHDQTTITRTVTHRPTEYITLEYAQFPHPRPAHNQAPMAAPPGVHAKGQETGQDPSHPHVTRATSSPVSGLYFLPISGASGSWPQMQQKFDPSSHSANNTEGSQPVQGNPRLGNSEPEGNLLLLQSRKIRARRNVFAGQADSDTTAFTRWGVEVLYNLRRRSLDHVSLFKESCIRNACSPQKQLNSMCNTNELISDPFRKQECEWCWPEDQRKQQEIDSHCTEVSKRALTAVFIVGGTVCFCTLIIASVLISRLLRRRRRAKAERILHKRATTASPLQEKTNSVPSHWFSYSTSKFAKPSKTARTRNDDTAIEQPSPGEAVGQNAGYRSVFTKPGKRSRIGPDDLAPGRLSKRKQKTKPLDQEIAVGDERSEGRVPVLPPASPAISSRRFSDIENMGQGRILPPSPGTNNKQRDAQEMPRRFSRQSRAASTSSEQGLSGATHRRDTGADAYNLQRLTERS